MTSIWRNCQIVINVVCCHPFSKNNKIIFFSFLVFIFVAKRAQVSRNEEVGDWLHHCYINAKSQVLRLLWIMSAYGGHQKKQAHFNWDDHRLPDGGGVERCCYCCGICHTSIRPLQHQLHQPPFTLPPISKWESLDLTQPHLFNVVLFGTALAKTNYKLLSKVRTIMRR